MGKGRAGQKIQGGIVVNRLPLHDTAMAVVGILTQAHVADHNQIRQLVF